MEILITGIRMRYAEFITSLSIPKGRVNINLEKSRKKRNVSLAFRFSTRNSS